MTRKDFQLIAATIAAIPAESTMEDGKPIGELSESKRRQIAEAFADKLAPTNRLFDRERFIEACGVAS